MSQAETETEELLNPHFGYAWTLGAIKLKNMNSLIILFTIVSLSPIIPVDSLKSAEYYYQQALEIYESAPIEGKEKENSFKKAFEFSQLALSKRPNWAKPRILIAHLYANSGNICHKENVDLGFNPIIWASIDMLSEAKSVQPELSKEIDEIINNYSNYLPKYEDIFIIGIKEGDEYFVDCWINKIAIVRIKK